MRNATGGWKQPDGNARVAASSRRKNEAGQLPRCRTACEVDSFRLPTIHSEMAGAAYRLTKHFESADYVYNPISWYALRTRT